MNCQDSGQKVYLNKKEFQKALIYITSDIRDRSGPGQLVPYIRMSLITDENYVHFGQTDRENRPS